MTIHNSNSSEYLDVVIILPAEGSPLLTRELLYAGFTRAKRTVTIVASEESLKTAVNSREIGLSGLPDLAGYLGLPYEASTFDFTKTSAGIGYGKRQRIRIGLLPSWDKYSAGPKYMKGIVAFVSGSFFQSRTRRRKVVLRARWLMYR